MPMRMPADTTVALLRRNVGALLHNWPTVVPYTIAHCQIGLQVSATRLWFTRVWVRPLVRWDPAIIAMSLITHTDRQTDRQTQTCLLWQDVASLPHEGTDWKPQAVHEVERVLQLLWVRLARVRVVPLARGYPANHNTSTARRVSAHAAWCIA
jgi:hypothetical protein